MRKTLAAIALTVVLTASSASPAFAFVDKNCGDFATQEEAQAFLVAAGPDDPHRLDTENDGIACESLPSGGGPSTTADGPAASKSSSKSESKSKSSSKSVAEGSTLSKSAAGTVIKVVDGDTVDVKVKAKKYRVRVLGIDTPEVYGGTECGGKSASAAMKKILKVGDKVKLKADRTQDNQDRYGRWLRYVSEKNVDVGLTLIKKGWADAYIYNDHPFLRSKAYAKGSASAERAVRGVWKACRGF